MSIASITTSLVASFNTYGASIKAKVAAAKSAADNAQSTANTVGTTAATAQTAANTAKAAADAAAAAAGTAQSTANLAKNTSDNNTSAITTLTQHVAMFDATQIWTKAQSGAVLPLVDAVTIAIDLETSNNFEVTLTGNRTLGTPTNASPGQSGLIKVVQDATGSRTLAFSSVFKFAGGTAPVLTTAAGAHDFLAYYVDDASNIYISVVKDVK